MPKIVAEDDASITYETDDGRIVRVARQALDRLGAQPVPMDDLGVPMGDLMAPSEQVRKEFASYGSAANPFSASAAPAPEVDVSGGIAAVPGSAGSVGIGEPPRAATRIADQGATGAMGSSVDVGRQAAGPEVENRTKPSGTGRATDIPWNLDNARGLQASGYGMQAESMEMANSADQQAADAAVAATARRNQLQQEGEAKIAKINAENQQKMEGLIAEKQAAVKAYMDAKPDRGRFWSSRSTGQKVAAGIGMALGALGQGMTGGDSNKALDLIMGAIKDDVDLQLVEIEKLGKNVGMHNEIISDAMKLGESRVGIEQALLASGIGSVMRDLELIQAQTASDKVRAAVPGFLGQLNQAMGEAMEKSVTADEKARFERWEAKQRVAQGWMGQRTARMGVEMSQQERQDKKDAAAAEAARSGFLFSGDVRMGDPKIGRYRFAGDTKQFVEDQERVIAFDSAYQKLRELRHISEELGRTYQGSFKALKGDDVRAGDALLMDLATAQARALNGARMSDKDVENEFKKLGGGLRGFLDMGSPDKTLKDVQRRNGREYKAFLRSRIVDENGQADDAAADRHVATMDKLSNAEWAGEERKSAVESAYSKASGAPDVAARDAKAEGWPDDFRGNYSGQDVAPSQISEGVQDLASQVMRGESEALDKLQLLAGEKGERGRLARRVLDDPRVKAVASQIEQVRGPKPQPKSTVNFNTPQPAGTKF